MGANLIRKMAGKKRLDVVQWQLEANNDEDWDDICKLRGLVVVDVFQEWCGPCTVMASQLKDLKLRLGDDYLHFAIAKADCITQLVKFRGRSEPTWVFMAAGEPVALVRGANAPLIRRTLMTELDKEKEVLSGIAERVTIDWNSIEFPRAVDESDVEEGLGEEPNPRNELPENWIDLDAILLRGAYSRILGSVRQQFADANVEIVHESQIEIDETGGPTSNGQMIVWLDVNEEDDTVVEWLENLLSSVTQEAIKNLKDEFKEDEEYKLEEEECKEESAPTPPPIEFKLLFNQQEKEDFINQLLAEPADTNGEGPVFIDVEEGQGSRDQEEPEQESEAPGSETENTEERPADSVENPQFHVEDCSGGTVDQPEEEPAETPDADES